MQLWHVKEHDRKFIANLAVLEYSIFDESFIGPKVTNGDVLLLSACFTKFLLYGLVVLAAYLPQLVSRN